MSQHRRIRATTEPDYLAILQVVHGLEASGSSAFSGLEALVRFIDKDSGVEIIETRNKVSRTQILGWIGIKDGRPYLTGAGAAQLGYLSAKYAQQDLRPTGFVAETFK
ncbi:MAG: hypothetical protein AABX69_04750 [Nanoarchaeota archaeon]